MTDPDTLPPDFRRALRRVTKALRQEFEREKAAALAEQRERIYDGLHRLAALNGSGVAVLKAFVGERHAKAFDADKHPRGDDGRFIHKDDIAAAATDPQKAEALRAKVTDPEQRAKLDAAIDGEKKGNTPSSDAPADPPAAPAKKLTVDQSVALVRRLMSPNGPTTSETVRQLGEAFAGHSKAELDELKQRLGIRASGPKAEVARKLAERAAAVDRSNRNLYVNEKLSVDEAHARIKALAADGSLHTPAGIRAVAQAVGGGLTGEELKELKGRLGLKASGPKAEVARKLVERAVRGATNRVAADVASATEPPQPAPEPPVADATPNVAADVAKKEPWQMTAEQYQRSGVPNYGDLVTDGRVAGILRGSGGLGSDRVTIHDSITGRNHYASRGDLKTIRRLGVGSAINDPMNHAEYHKRQVAAALAAGKPVPPEVLADYPDLKPADPPHPASIPVASTAAGSDYLSAAASGDQRRRLIGDKLRTAGAVLPDEAVDHFTTDGSGRVTESRALTALQNVHGLSEPEAKAVLAAVAPAGTVTVGGNRKRPAYAVTDLYRAMGKLYEPGENLVTPGGGGVNPSQPAQPGPTTRGDDAGVPSQVRGGAGGRQRAGVGAGGDAGAGAADRTDDRGGRGAAGPAAGVEGVEPAVAGPDRGRGGQQRRVEGDQPGAAAGGRAAGQMTPEATLRRIMAGEHPGYQHADITRALRDVEDAANGGPTAQPGKAGGDALRKLAASLGVPDAHKGDWRSLRGRIREHVQAGAVRAGKEKPAEETSPNPTSVVDKPTSVGDTTGVGQPTAAPKPEGGGMTSELPKLRGGSQKEAELGRVVRDKFLAKLAKVRANAVEVSGGRTTDHTAAIDAVEQALRDDRDLAAAYFWADRKNDSFDATLRAIENSLHLSRGEGNAPRLVGLGHHGTRVLLPAQPPAGA